MVRPSLGTPVRRPTGKRVYPCHRRCVAIIGPWVRLSIVFLRILALTRNGYETFRRISDGT